MKLCDALSYLLNHLGIYYVSDIVQIALFVFITYRFTMFLHQSTAPRLTHYFNLWATSYVISYWLNWYPCIILLLFLAPLLFISFMIFHQERIHKNFIASRQVKEDHGGTLASDWVETLIKGCLKANMQKKEIRFVIQRHDDITSLFIVPIIINALLNPTLISFILSHVPNTNTETLLINQQGILLGTEAFYKNKETSNDWDTNAHLITKANDCIAVLCHASSMHFQVIAQGLSLYNLSATDTTRLIKSIIYKTHLEGKSNEARKYSSRNSTNTES